MDLLRTDSAMASSSSTAWLVLDIEDLGKRPLSSSGMVTAAESLREDFLIGKFCVELLRANLAGEERFGDSERSTATALIDPAFLIWRDGQLLSIRVFIISKRHSSQENRPRALIAARR